MEKLDWGAQKVTLIKFYCGLDHLLLDSFKSVASNNVTLMEMRFNAFLIRCNSAIPNSNNKNAICGGDRLFLTFSLALPHRLLS